MGDGGRTGAGYEEGRPDMAIRCTTVQTVVSGSGGLLRAL